MTPPSNPHLLTAEEIGRGLHAKRIGRRIIVLPEIDSTNTYALNLAMQADLQLDDGTVVFAEYQTAGRGRLGRQWISPRGAGLHLTALLIERRQRFSHTRLMMATAVAVLDGIQDSTDVEPTIRWPNDLYVADRKLCGILIETRAHTENLLVVAVGVGINCLQQPLHFPPELRRRATSLDIESRQPIERASVARAIIASMDHVLQEESEEEDSTLAVRWRERSSDLYTRATLTSEGSQYSGQIVDIHPIEGLVLQMDNGKRRHFDPAITTRC